MRNRLGEWLVLLTYVFLQVAAGVFPKDNPEMATSAGGGGSGGKGEESGGAITDPELWREQQRFFNFLQHYQLHRYHQRFLQMGVRRLTHFKDVTDADLDAVGLKPPEKARLWKKLDENFSTKGKIRKTIAGKAKAFDGDSPPENPHAFADSTPQEASLIAKEDIQLEKKLGEGAHGTVFEGTWSNKHGSVVVAVKTLYGREEVHSTFIKEAQSMRALLHPHIIQLYGIVLSAPLMLVEELAPCGNLHTFLKEQGASKNLGLFHAYATQISDAMKYLEEKRIVHRDLATRNILLATEELLKLSDFGMARILDEQTGVYNLSNLQSRIPVAWTALEALTHAKFSPASDVWSYAVTLWEIYSLGEIPWKGLSPIETRDCLLRGERLGCPERCPPEVYHVMTSSWEARPQDRPTFSSIYQRLQRSKPVKLRAIKTHAVAADTDNNCLSFQKGDLLFLINKPKQGWLYGMLMDGKIGYFLEDHVTTCIDPIGDIKEKLQAGKAKVAALPISGPTQVSHELHWGKNGEKWGETEKELTSNQAAVARSPLHSPPFTVVLSPGHSPTTQQRLQQPPNARYTQHSPTFSTGSSGASPTHPEAAGIGEEDGDMILNDQYVTMRRGATMVPEDRDDYIDMQPSKHAEQPNRVSMYENITQDDRDVDFYSVPNPRSSPMFPSDTSSGGGSRPGSSATNRPALPPREKEASKRALTLPAGVNPQYSTATGTTEELLADTPTGALSPTNVRFLPTALPSSATAAAVEQPARFHSSVGDVREGGGGGVNPPTVRPRPRPRKDPSAVQRSASMAYSDTSATNGPHKFSLLEKTPTDMDLIRLADTVEDSSLHNRPPNRPPKPDDLKPLLPESAPPVPNRTYLSPTHTSNPKTLNGSAKAAPLPPHFDNPLAEEFPDADEELCRTALESHNSDIEKAREEVQVQILLGMRISHTKPDDCRRALRHCQGKIDRAAIWLVERDIHLAERSA